MRSSVITVTVLAAALVMATPAAAQGDPADVCLEVASGVLSAEEWNALDEAVEVAVVARPLLFPAPSIHTRGSRLDIDSGHPGLAVGEGPCLEPGHEWSARFDRVFLEAGADLMLEQAPTTPGIGSEVALEWYPDETRVRTTLEFAGPLDFPNGTCWIDDVLTVEAGVVLASGEHGLRTSPFAEGACRRFADHLPDGGAGEQAVTLLPTTVELGDGTTVRLVADDVFVREDAVVVAGSLARD